MLWVHTTYEPGHNKTYNKTCATSEESDQTAHSHSLIRVFADCMCLLLPPGYRKGDEPKPLPYWMDGQVDLSLCWSHRSYCRFCHALSHIFSWRNKMPKLDENCFRPFKKDTVNVLKF